MSFLFEMIKIRLPLKKMIENKVFIMKIDSLVRFWIPVFITLCERGNDKNKVTAEKNVWK